MKEGLTLSDELAKSTAATEYFVAVETLEALRARNVPWEEIVAAQDREKEAWARVKELMPDAFCR